jgi:hypothetical protein
MISQVAWGREHFAVGIHHPVKRPRGLCGDELPKTRGPVLTCEYPFRAGMAELADAADSKSADLRVLGVRLPLPAPHFPRTIVNRGLSHW